MKNKVIEHLEILFKLYSDLAQSASEDFLSKTLEVPKNKTLTEHLWCIVGARESYAHALEAGEWVGFDCSLESEAIGDKGLVMQHLASSAQAVRESITVVSDWTEGRQELLLSLLEHETMHEGQIIRLVYGLNETLPQSWLDRWA